MLTDKLVSLCSSILSQYASQELLCNFIFLVLMFLGYYISCVRYFKGLQKRAWDSKGMVSIIPLRLLMTNDRLATVVANYVVKL